MKLNRSLLLAGSVMPLLYFFVIYAAGAFYPGYSHVRQVASDLGADGAAYPYAAIFNIGLLAVAVTGLAGALGLFWGLKKTRGGVILPALTGLTLAMPSISLGMSGLFPLPSPWHSSFELLLAGILTPLLGAIALSKVPGTAMTRAALVVSFAGALMVLAALFGAGGLVSEENVGLWLRLWAVASMPAVGLLCWTVRSRITP